MEAGLVLTGAEVKAIRLGQVSFRGSHVAVANQEALLVGFHIHPYAPARTENYDPQRPRRLLLHHQEIQHLAASIKQKGITAVPAKIYTSHKKIKVEIAIVKGKGKKDKREDLKKKALERELEIEFRHPE